MGNRQAGRWVTTGNSIYTRGFNAVSQRQRKVYMLTSAVVISGTMFNALLAALLHTKSMGLVSASHTLEATIHSSRSPG